MAPRTLSEIKDVCPEKEVEIEGERSVSRADLAFLIAIQEVNRNPEEYVRDDETDGEAPATTGRIERVSGLKKRQVHYRLDEASLDEEGYITVLAPPILEKQFGAKSARLTESGEELLREAKEVMFSSNRADDEEVVTGAESVDPRLQEIEDRMSDLSEEVESLNETVKDFQESDSGAWDDPLVNQFSTTLSAVVGYDKFLSEVLGVSTDLLRKNGKDLSEEDFAQLEREIGQTVLELAENGRDGIKRGEEVESLKKSSIEDSDP